MGGVVTVSRYCAQMEPKTRGVVVHLIWAVGGLAVGATAALLWVKGLKSEWVEATGTWFGAIATVLALLWAVQTFRADQAHRDAERQSAASDRADAQAREQAEIRADAARVALALRGGGGYGHDGEKSMTGVFIDIHNDSDQPVIVTKVILDDGLTTRSPVPTPIRIKSRESWTQQFDTEPVPVSDGELSGNPLVSYGGSITFEVHDRAWSKTTAGQLKEASRSSA